MALGGQLNISVTVTGADQLSKLREHTDALNASLKDTKHIKDMAGAQAKNEIAQLSVNNKLLGYKYKLGSRDLGMLARRMNINEDLTKQSQHNLAVERGAERLKAQAKKDNMTLSIKEARVVSAANIEEAAAIKQAEMAIKAKRRALMQVSISMFVFNISIGQMVSSLLPLVKGNEEATKALKGYQAVLMLSMGPMQAYMAMKMILMNLEKQHAAAVFAVVTGMSAAYFWYAALTSKSREMRAVLGALAGVMTVLALRQAYVAVTAWQAAVASATGKAVMGDLSGWLKVGVGLGIAAAVGAAIGTLTAPRAQTLTGQGKYVREGGFAKLDPGETVMRASAAGGGGGGDTYHFHFPPGTQATSSQARTFGKVFARQQNMGMGRKTSRSVRANV